MASTVDTLENKIKDALEPYGVEAQARAEEMFEISLAMFGPPSAAKIEVKYINDVKYVNVVITTQGIERGYTVYYPPPPKQPTTPCAQSSQNV